MSLGFFFDNQEKEEKGQNCWKTRTQTHLISPPHPSSPFGATVVDADVNGNEYVFVPRPRHARMYQGGACCVRGERTRNKKNEGKMFLNGRGGGVGRGRVLCMK